LAPTPNILRFSNVISVTPSIVITFINAASALIIDCPGTP
jgi:hypothetical protein